MKGNSRFFGNDLRTFYLTAIFSRLRYDLFERECEATLSRNSKIARNCASTVKYIVMQLRKVNCEKVHLLRSVIGENKSRHFVNHLEEPKPIATLWHSNQIQ